MPLHPKVKQQLKAKAHSLKPVVLLGQHGLTEAVLKEIDGALLAHELIKVKFATTDRDEKHQAFASICTSLQAECVQTIGNVAVIYRKKAE